MASLCPSLLQEQEELHSYRARVLAELEEEKKKLESHIAEIQEGRVSAALGWLVVGKLGYTHQCLEGARLILSISLSLQGESDSTTDLDTSLKGECQQSTQC